MVSTLVKASIRFKENRLVVNCNKSCLIPIVSINKVKLLCSDINICLDDKPIEVLDNAKLLGLYIDQTLSFNDHTNSLVKRVSSKIAVLHRLRQFLASNILNTVYLTTIQPIFDYCLSVWGNSSKQNINAIQKLQNRSARAVTGNFDYSSSVTNIRNDLGWMNIKTRFDYFTLILMYKSLNSLAPDYLTNRFKYKIIQCSTLPNTKCCW